jgi:cytochrome c553
MSRSIIGMLRECLGMTLLVPPGDGLTCINTRSRGWRQIRRMSPITAALGAAALALCWCASASAAQPAITVESRAALVAHHVCERCHGPGGRSRKPAFPTLAAQQPGYLAEQIEAFRTSREEPEGQEHMLGVAVAFDDDMIAALAHYFSSQPPLAGRRGNPERIRAGRDLYLGGVPQHPAPPCASCHGERAEGNALVPRLAGQHAVYLVRQLRVIQSSERDSDLMHEASGELTPDQMRALALYLQSR